MRFKDARDIINIIHHYFESEADLIYEQHSDLFGDESGDLPLEIISAIVVAREIRKMVAANDSLKQRLQGILKKHIDQQEKSALVRNMVNESETNVEQVAAILEAMLAEMLL